MIHSDILTTNWLCSTRLFETIWGRNVPNWVTDSQKGKKNIFFVFTGSAAATHHVSFGVRYRLNFKYFAKPQCKEKSEIYCESEILKRLTFYHDHNLTTGISLNKFCKLLRVEQQLHSRPFFKKKIINFHISTSRSIQTEKSCTFYW